MVQEEKGSLDSDGQERDALYEQAERLSSSLVTMGQQLRETVEVCCPLHSAAVAKASKLIHCFCTSRTDIWAKAGKAYIAMGIEGLHHLQRIDRRCQMTAVVGSSAVALHRTMFQGANAVAARSMGDPNQPLGKLVKIMNNQLQALTQLDARTGELAARVDTITSGEAPCIFSSRGWRTHIASRRQLCQHKRPST